MPGKTRFAKGEDVIFRARTGRKMPAKVVSPKISKGQIEVNIAGDPYPVLVKANQLQKVREGTMAESTGAAIRKLSKRAKLLGIRGYQNMDEKELRRAVKREEDSYDDIAKPSKSSKSKSKPSKTKPKAKATKPAKAEKPKATKKATNGTAKKTSGKKVSKEKAKVAPKTAGDPANPFRHGSNSWKMAEELLKGGKRSDMIKRLKKSMPLHPWSKDKEEEPTKAINKRILLTAAAMERDHGFKIKSEGRGTSGTIKAIPPGAKKKSSAKSASKPSSKKTAGQKKSGKASSKATTSKAKKKAKR